jgi:hypothetical protein
MPVAIASGAVLGACWRKLSSPPYIGAEWKVRELHSQITKLGNAEPGSPTTGNCATPQAWPPSTVRIEPPPSTTWPAPLPSRPCASHSAHNIVINIGGHVRKSQLSSGRSDIGEAQAAVVAAP